MRNTFPPRARHVVNTQPAHNAFSEASTAATGVTVAHQRAKQRLRRANSTRAAPFIRSEPTAMCASSMRPVSRSGLPTAPQSSSSTSPPPPARPHCGDAHSSSGLQRLALVSRVGNIVHILATAANSSTRVLLLTRDERDSAHAICERGLHPALGDGALPRALSCK